MNEWLFYIVRHLSFLYMFFFFSYWTQEFHLQGEKYIFFLSIYLRLPISALCPKIAAMQNLALSKWCLLVLQVNHYYLSFQKKVQFVLQRDNV